MYFGDLQQGSSGADVQQLQQSLETLGYSVGSSGVDGQYGPDTAAAVTQFQRDHGLTADGIYGPQTTAALASALTSPSGSGATSSSSGPAIVTTPPEFGPANPLVGPPAAGSGAVTPGGPTQAPLTTAPSSIMGFLSSPVGIGVLAVGAIMMTGSGKGSGKGSRRSSRSRRRRR